MPRNPNELQRLVLDLKAYPRETEWLEMKKNNHDPQMIGEYISALSNSACLEGKDKGYLLFGIENKTHRITGTDFNPKEKIKKGQELENWIATLLNPRIDFEFEEVEFDEGKVVVIIIDAAHDRPVEFRGEAYIRIGTNKKQLKEHPEKARRIWTKERDFPFEKGAATKPLHQEELWQFLDHSSYFNAIGRATPQDWMAIKEKFEEEGFIEEREGAYVVTNLGAILFGKDLSDFEDLPRKGVRVIFYKDLDRTETVFEQTGQKGYVIGFSKLIGFIMERLPTNEVIQEAIRKDIPVYPEIAVRELVANALIHQDLNVKGSSPMVEIFSNRIEITNPGKPVIDTNRFIDHSPESRNEKMAAFMRRVGICEERGSGIDKVITAVEDHQLPPPHFIDGDGFTRVILFKPASYSEMDRVDKIRATYQHCCLKFVSGQLMTNASLRGRFGIPRKNYPIVSRIIKDAIQEAWIKNYDPSSESKKDAKYIPFWA